MVYFLKITGDRGKTNGKSVNNVVLLLDKEILWGKIIWMFKCLYSRSKFADVSKQMQNLFK